LKDQVFAPVKRLDRKIFCSEMTYMKHYYNSLSWWRF